MPRPQKQRCICSLPRAGGFIPQGCEASGSVNLTYDEYEVIRLLDHRQMTQEQCAERMGISRPTVTRIYDEARRKVADMLVNSRNLSVRRCARNARAKSTAATGNGSRPSGGESRENRYRQKAKLKKTKLNVTVKTKKGKRQRT